MQKACFSIMIIVMILKHSIIINNLELIVLGMLMRLTFIYSDHYLPFLISYLANPEIPSSAQIVPITACMVENILEDTQTNSHYCSS